MASTSSTSTQPISIVLDPSLHKPFISSFVSIHMACITTDHTVATFLPPLDASRVMNFWLEKFERAEKGKVWLIACLVPKDGKHDAATTPAGRLPDDEDELRHTPDLADRYHLAGYAYLQSNASETGPFRGEVLKLLVDPKFRRRGVATSVMARLEKVATEVGLTQLVLDTTEGSGAEHVYPKLGYTCIGVIPAEGVSPKDGRLINEIFFYKHLEGHGKSGEVWKGWAARSALG